jgi:hypothetical protein
MPFVHLLKWQFSEYSVELIFGITAIGAQYWCENMIAKQLFFVRLVDG